MQLTRMRPDSPRVMELLFVHLDRHRIQRSAVVGKLERIGNFQSLTTKAVTKGPNHPKLVIVYRICCGPRQRDHLPQVQVCLVDRGLARLLLQTRGTPDVRWRNCTKGIQELLTGFCTFRAGLIGRSLTLLLVVFRPIGGVLEETIRHKMDLLAVLDVACPSGVNDIPAGSNETSSGFDCHTSQVQCQGSSPHQRLKCWSPKFGSGAEQFDAVELE